MEAVRSVDVWEIPLQASDAELDRFERLLDRQELLRLRKFPRADLRRRFTVSHAATRIILGKCLGIEPAGIAYQLGQWGKPGVVGSSWLQHNLSHSDEIALLAISRGEPVGVDVEAAQTTVAAVALANRFFLPTEAQSVAAQPVALQVPRFLRLWTRKEAAGKASGLPLDQALKFPVDAISGCALSNFPAGGSRQVADLDRDGAYIGAVALLGEGHFTVTRRQWSSRQWADLKNCE